MNTEMQVNTIDENKKTAIKMKNDKIIGNDPKMKINNIKKLKIRQNNYVIEEFHPKLASEDIWEKYFEICETHLEEIYPQDPLPLRIMTKRFMIDQHPDNLVFRWLIYDGNQINKLIGYSYLSYVSTSHPAYDENKHVAYIHIVIAKEFRRLGVGTEFLKFILAKVENKKILQTYAQLESGINFNIKLGGLEALKETESRLYLDSVDWDMILKWIDTGPSNVDIETHLTILEKDLLNYCKLKTKILKQVPIGDLEWTPNVTPESNRLEEKRLQEKGIVRITLFSREQDGCISGLTEIFWSKEDRPMQVQQGLTGVDPKYQSRGLGKWLKAGMLRHIQTNYHQVQYLRTENATQNAPMLSINNRMGFKPLLTDICYKFQINSLRECLALTGMKKITLNKPLKNLSDVWTFNS